MIHSGGAARGLSSVDLSLNEQVRAQEVDRTCSGAHLQQCPLVLESCFSWAAFLLLLSVLPSFSSSLPQQWTFSRLGFSPAQGRWPFLSSCLPIPSISLESHEVESVLGMPMSKVMSPLVTVQAKVTEELAAATAQVSHLQLKMTVHQKKETELQVQLTENLKETDLLRGQVTRLQANLSGKFSEENVWQDCHLNSRS